MAVFPIRTLPDPVLRQKAKRIRILDSSIEKLITDMLETLHDKPGRAGLAAPQIGISLRVIVINTPEAGDLILVNPNIVRKTGERTVEEGCLSIPGYFGQITRSVSVTAKGLDQHGKAIRIKATELLAQALEHEIDHLNGVLYIDRLDNPDNLHKIAPEENDL